MLFTMEPDYYFVSLFCNFIAGVKYFSHLILFQFLSCLLLSFAYLLPLIFLLPQVVFPDICQVLSFGCSFFPPGEGSPAACPLPPLSWLLPGQRSCCRGLPFYPSDQVHCFFGLSPISHSTPSQPSLLHLK